MTDQPPVPAAGASTVVWSWQPQLGPDLRRNVRLVAAGIGLAIVVSVVVTVLSPARFVIVMTLLLAGIAVLWRIEHRKFTSTIVELDSAGVLRVTDGSTSSALDLAAVDTIAVRSRTGSGESSVLANDRWWIELSGAHGTLSHRMAQAGGLFAPDRDDLGQLEMALREHAARIQRYQAGPGPTAAPVAPANPPQASPDAPFVWRVRTSPNADRRRWWFRVGYGGVALLIAVIGAAAAWGDWVGVVLSALTVPGMILAICGGFDYAITRARRFRVEVTNGVLSVGHGAKAQQIPLRGATVGIEQRSQMVATGDGTQRSVRWHLEVQAADGSRLDRIFPSWGTTTTHDDYVALERELRRRT